MKIIVLAAVLVGALAMPTTEPGTTPPVTTAGVKPTSTGAKPIGTENPGVTVTKQSGDEKSKENEVLKPTESAGEINRTNGNKGPKPECLQDNEYGVEPGEGPLTFEEINNVADHFRTMTEDFKRTLVASLGGAELWNSEKPTAFLEGVKKIKSTFETFASLGEAALKYLESAEHRAGKHGFPLKKPCSKAVSKLYAEQPRTPGPEDLSMYQEAVKLDVLCIEKYLKEVLDLVNVLASANENTNELEIVRAFGGAEFYVAHIVGASSALHYSLGIAEAMLAES